MRAASSGTRLGLAVTHDTGNQDGQDGAVGLRIQEPVRVPVSCRACCARAGIFLPVTVAACVGLVRGAPWAYEALYLVVGWFGLVGPAVAAMALTMYINDDPNASVGATDFMTALGLVLLLLALYLYRSLFRSPKVGADHFAGS